MRDDSLDTAEQSPLPGREIPIEVRVGNWDRAEEWLDGLSTDDLQRYGIVGLRGADPRIDVPEDYPNRDEVVQMMLRLGLYAAGVEAAGDQTEWLREHSSSRDGGLGFSSRGGRGPEWGWILDERRLDVNPCQGATGYKLYVYYYLWREGGDDDGDVIGFDDPVGAEHNRRIMASDFVHTVNLGVQWKICSMTMSYSSATGLDGTVLNGSSVETTTTGYHRGLTSSYGENIRSQGWPYFSRTAHADCISNGIDCDVHQHDCSELGGENVIQPDMTTPPAKYLDRYAGGSRYGDYFGTPCAAWECDSCWYLAHDASICEQGICCHRDSPSGDSCFFTTGTHTATVWDHGDYANDAENYYYDGPGDYNTAITRRVEWSANALVAASGSYSVGGWMNQVVYSSASGQGSYSLIQTDGQTVPTGATVNGNSQAIKVNINVNDSALWLNRDLKIGCRPFWRWNIKREANVVPYYLQLAYDGTVGCDGSYTEYNNWMMVSSSNPKYCNNGQFYIGTIMYDLYNSNHAPWEIESPGWLHPCVTFVRQNPGTNCNSPTTFNVTYYPLKSVVAQQGMPGSYIEIYAKSITS